MPEQRLWFKRKWYGWGWYPSSWQGWLITFIYLVALIALAMTLDESSSRREVAFTFLLPATILTAAFIRLAYRTGESPKWQWGRPSENELTEPTERA